MTYYSWTSVSRKEVASLFPLILGAIFLCSMQPLNAEQPQHLIQLKQTRVCVKCNLKQADLSNARLTGAVLRETNLKQANLEGADLRFAFLRQVNLRKANLTNADLTGAILRDVNLDGAILTGAKLPTGFKLPSNQKPSDQIEIKLPEIKLPRKP